MRSPTADPHGVGSDALEPLNSGAQQPASPLHGVRRRDQAAPVLLKACELRRRLGLAYRKFRQFEEAGAFDALKAPLAGYYSVVKVERWLNGGMDEPTRRFLSSHKPRVSRTTR